MQSYLEEDRHSADYNWLVTSKSSYLKKFETNPVNWLEWSPVAFEKARRENKLVFLMIGNSTQDHSHMKSIIGDNDIAQLLNESFVSILVDGKEYPHIGERYGQQLMDSHPFIVFLTSDQLAFYSRELRPQDVHIQKEDFMEVIESQLKDRNSKNRSLP